MLLPGAVLRVLISERPDLLPLLLHVLDGPIKARLSKLKTSSVIVGCVHLRSSANGQRHANDHALESRPLGLSDDDTLSEYGTVARLLGIESLGPGNLALVVEGLGRFRLVKVMQERPLLRGAVQHHAGDGMHLPDRPSSRSARCRLLHLGRRITAHGCRYACSVQDAQTACESIDAARPPGFSYLRPLDIHTLAVDDPTSGSHCGR